VFVTVQALLNNRKNFFSGSKLEGIIGYSRAVRAGNLVFVSGTTGVDDRGSIVSETDAYLQARQSILNISKALESIGGSLKDIVRTRVFVRKGIDWTSIAKAHFEFFHEIMPTSSMLVCEFLDPKIMVEIEADAVLDEQ
jgi:enamine deaminase RidA (YjgF/YER057c/UK114 family)